jgi:hypothetical protein
VVCGATTLLDDLARYGMPTQVEKAACDFASLDWHPQPPLFCDTLPDCSVTLRLSSNYSPLSVAYFYAFANPLNKYPIYSHIPMSRRLWAGSSILFGHVLFDLSCSYPPVWASTHFVILWHTVQ